MSFSGCQAVLCRRQDIQSPLPDPELVGHFVTSAGGGRGHPLRNTVESVTSGVVSKLSPTSVCPCKLGVLMGSHQCHREETDKRQMSSDGGWALMVSDRSVSPRSQGTSDTVCAMRGCWPVGTGVTPGGHALLWNCNQVALDASPLQMGWVLAHCSPRSLRTAAGPGMTGCREKLEVMTLLQVHGSH